MYVSPIGSGKGMEGKGSQSPAPAPGHGHTTWASPPPPSPSVAFLSTAKPGFGGRGKDRPLPRVVCARLFAGRVSEHRYGLEVGFLGQRARPDLIRICNTPTPRPPSKGPTGPEKINAEGPSTASYLTYLFPRAAVLAVGMYLGMYMLFYLSCREACRLPSRMMWAMREW